MNLISRRCRSSSKKRTHLRGRLFTPQVNYRPYACLFGQQPHEGKPELSLSQNFFRVVLSKALERRRAQTFDQRCAQCVPVVLTKVEHSVPESPRLRHIEIGLKTEAWSSTKSELEESLPTLIKGMRNESKYQKRNSCMSSKRFNESVTDTLDCLLAPGVSGASQSQSDVPNPCRTLCNVKVSYLRIDMNVLMSTNICQRLSRGERSARTLSDQLKVLF